MLRLVPELLDSIDMVSGFNKLLRVIDTVMPEPGGIQSIIAQKDIRIDYVVWFNRPSNHRNQCIVFGRSG